MSAPLSHVVAQQLARLHALPSAAPDALRFPMAGLNITLSGAPQSYQELCKRALHLQPTPEAPQLHISVALYERADPPLSPDESTTPVTLTQSFESLGADGYLDNQYHLWQSMQDGRALQWMRGPEEIAPWEASFPLRHFIHWSHARRNARLIHAGSLGIGERGVLLAGAGGAGKSGTTLGGLLSGLSSVGDDYLLLQRQGDRYLARPLMRLMKQDARGLSRLGIEGGEERFGPLNWQNKFEFDPELMGFGLKPRALQCQAILLPHISNATRSQITPARPQEVMGGLLANNLQQLPGHFAQGFAFLSTLVRSLPGYHLEMSSDPHEISDCIARFIETLPNQEGRPL